jgi:NADH-quinone oxidoreductase subunit J
MSFEMAGFYALAVLLIASSLSVILARSAVYSALALVLALFLIAVLFLGLSAPMVAVLQVLVYAGAIMVLFLFVIMLLNPGAVENRSFLGWSLTLMVAALLALELITTVLFYQTEAGGFGAGPVKEDFGSPQSLGLSLFNDYVLPFEVASILLLVAIVGAVVLAKRES